MILFFFLLVCYVIVSFSPKLCILSNAGILFSSLMFLFLVRVLLAEPYTYYKENDSVIIIYANLTSNMFAKYKCVGISFFMYNVVPYIPFAVPIFIISKDRVFV